ncbi:uncharacterized protein LOC109704177 isoform X2 [Ananas comosus]|uniref:Uncharacterized protein LOC109704177 isoform X2 n=1 Tax=Ananas comosus TaxID=4615 RepID=A0A6P5EBL0_ANACO|nr:uncharacterized protein LOC109704177 isoform X2 [Ananas comosus]
MERDLRNLRQGDRTVAEYEREFSRLLHCVPFVVRDDEDKARIFEVGLRPAIFRLVQASNLSTYWDVVNRALIVEKGAEIMKERDVVDRSKGKRPAAESSGQQSFRRPPKYPRGQTGQSGQSRGRGSSAPRGAPERRRPPRCVICGGPHVPPQCPQRGGRCFLCGQEGHFRSECPRGSLPAPSSATAPASSAPSQGTPTAPYQSRRPSGQRQSESSQQGSSGRMYAAQTEGAAAAQEVVAGSRTTWSLFGELGSWFGRYSNLSGSSTDLWVILGWLWEAFRDLIGALGLR